MSLFSLVKLSGSQITNPDSFDPTNLRASLLDRNQKEVWLDPNSISSMEQSHDSTVVSLSNGRVYAIKQTPVEIQELVIQQDIKLSQTLHEQRMQNLKVTA